MLLAVLAVIFGLLILIWSADKFVDGASGVAIHFGMSPLLIGMVIVGFGTSLPEMVVSSFSALDGNPGLAIGNAYGSNIANIALILGVTAFISPIHLHSKILKKELPILLGITVFVSYLIMDLNVSLLDGIIHLFVFVLIMSWTVYSAKNSKNDELEKEFDEEYSKPHSTLMNAIMLTFFGLTLVMGSSKLLVWGAVVIAKSFGVSDLIIGLTVVAIGTSLPELASSITAIKKGENDIALGNVLGSNLFNTLAVVGIAGTIKPFEIEKSVLYRDVLVMILLTISLFFFKIGVKRDAIISKKGGLLYIISYLVYIGFLSKSIF